MRKVTYLAVFEPSTDGGYGVYFPDLPGCISYGTDFQEAQRMATEALGLHLYGMEKDNDEIPLPTDKPAIEPETADGYLVSPVTIYPDMVRNEMNTRAVKITTTIPSWMKELAEEKKVNYSQLLQTALIDYLHVGNSSGNFRAVGNASARKTGSAAGPRSTNGGGRIAAYSAKKGNQIAASPLPPSNFAAKSSNRISGQLNQKTTGKKKDGTIIK